MTILSDILQDIQSGKNLDVYITILVALVVAFLAVFGIIEPAIVSSAILATLALVSMSLLANRKREQRTHGGYPFNREFDHAALHPLAVKQNLPSF